MSVESKSYSVEILDSKRNVTYYRQYDAMTIEEAKQKLKQSLWMLPLHLFLF